MNIVYKTTTVFFICILLFSCKGVEKSKTKATDNYVSIVKNDSLHKIDIIIDGAYFTSYLYADSILRKPVLFPIFSANNKRITRGFPINPNSGERVDHPHHYGLWFNHGVVNNVDYWNSAVVPKDEEVRYGRINHTDFITIESGDEGILEVKKEWRNDLGELVLTEITKYIFSGDKNIRTIAHTTTLSAIDEDVLFTDSKEGMFALRVRRELEVASNKPDRLLTENLTISDSAIVDNSNVTGYYRNSEGVEGYPDVWGKRAKWMELEGKIKSDSIAILIFDHSKNINHPPHWMARDYGLYAVNSFGNSVYTDGKETLNFNLVKGKSITFKHQVHIIEGQLPIVSSIEKMYSEFE